VSLDTADGVLVIEVRELPWRKRNDLGELVLHTYQDAVNRLIEPDGSATRVDVGLIESLIDYQGILAIAFPGLEPDYFDALTFSQMTSLAAEALKINGFDRMVHLVDPKESPPPTGENEAPTDDPTDDGQKTDSATSSG
jgi:hypothetical protein